MQEIWKDVPGYEGLYQVSNIGNVRSLKWNHSNQTRLLTPFNNGGYARIGFRQNGILKNYLVHVLVAKAFIPNPHNKPSVNHIDGNKLNNTVQNLEWVTYSENTRHAIAHNLRPAGCNYQHKKGADNPISKKVLQTSLDGNFSKLWLCSQDAAQDLGFSIPSIRRCCRGERKTYKKFHWQYV